ncbi:MAG: hypothetical protein GQ546_09350 [Gammaproteobacteria bacterium]|nr:hypothetical protein [Gammaproteobacteria bacterium]
MSAILLVVEEIIDEQADISKSKALKDNKENKRGKTVDLSIEKVYANGLGNTNRI